MKRSRPRSEGLRITKVGLWFLVFAVVVLIAATNTGNNGLFLVLAIMGATLLVSQVLASRNVRGLGIAIHPPPEVFANRLTRLEATVENRSRWLPRWLLVLSVGPGDMSPEPASSSRRAVPRLIPYLPRLQTDRGAIEVQFRRRGRFRLQGVRLNSLFPLGFFHKGVRYPIDEEILVFPEIYPPGGTFPTRQGRSGDEASRRSGRGHGLHGLRSFRPGDDPRAIHWKQSARIGSLIFKEQESEESRRLLILFDNAVGSLQDQAAARRFERLVSEAATAALDHLAQGFEVGLVTRERRVVFGSGARQRRTLLEILALVGPLPVSSTPLVPPDDPTLHLHLAMEPQEPLPSRQEATA